MSGLSGRDKTRSLEAQPNYFYSSQAKGGGRGTQNISTGYSSLLNGNLTLDPSIRTIQDQSLANINNLYNQTGDYGNELVNNSRGLRGDSLSQGNDIRALNNQFSGNNSAYIQAQVDPVAQAMAQRSGQLEQNIGLRGLSGSSFGDQAKTSNLIDSERAISNARANATMQNNQLALSGQDALMRNLQTTSGIDAQLAANMFNKVNTQAQLNGESLQVAKDRLIQEMQALGLGLQQQQMMIQAFEASQSRASGDRKAIAGTIMQGFGMGGGSGSTGSGGSSGIGGGQTGNTYGGNFGGSLGYTG